MKRKDKVSEGNRRLATLSPRVTTAAMSPSVFRYIVTCRRLLNKQLLGGTLFFSNFPQATAIPFRIFQVLLFLFLPEKQTLGVLRQRNSFMCLGPRVFP